MTEDNGFGGHNTIEGMEETEEKDQRREYGDLGINGRQKT